jgi:MFS family permease
VVNSAGVGGLLNRRYGRKRSFQIAAATTILAVCIQIAPFRAFWPLVAGRILFGFGGNLNGRTLGLYLSEISSADDRGRTTILGVGFLPAAVSILSNIVAFCTAFMPVEKSYSWRVANGIQIVPGVVFLRECTARRAADPQPLELIDLHSSPPQSSPRCFQNHHAG